MSPTNFLCSECYEKLVQRKAYPASEKAVILTFKVSPTKTNFHCVL